MSENTYEYECMRAELLGIEKPDYEQFMKNRQEKQAAEDEDIDTEHLKEIDAKDDSMQNISGGLDELNTILKVTQRKINNFKASCGSLTSMFRTSRSNSIQEQPVTESCSLDGQECKPEEPKPQNSQTNGDKSEPRKSDLAKALDNHVDRIDSLLDKAENAQYSMGHQNKQMRKFLNK